MVAMMLLVLNAEAAAVCSGGYSWEQITYNSPTEIAEFEAKAAATELREPRPAPANGAVRVKVSRATLTENTGEHFVIAFGDPAKPAELDRRQQPRQSPTPVSSVWHNTFFENVPTALPTTVHFIDEAGNRRCSATIDARGKVKRLK